MKRNSGFEYDGEFQHASEKYAEAWRVKGLDLVPPPEAFHQYLVITRRVMVTENGQI